MKSMTMTSTSRSTGCGCGCGPSGAGSAAFTRPRFFAGQLLTEDDLEQLTAYITGKDRLRNRMLFGPGVVSGLQVVCAPCGGGDVVVRPGYALDCCGNEIVVGCPETVPVTALVNEMRVRGLGVDCGDPCADGTSGTTSGRGAASRCYGLYVRYTEVDAEPVAPYSTQEPCPPAGCVPSRIREGFTFLVKCPQPPPDHRYRPGDVLLRGLGDLPGASPVFGLTWSRGRRLDQYRERLRAAAAAEGHPIVFTPDDANRFTATLGELSWELGEVAGAAADASTVDMARLMTETVRGLASSLARYDLYDAEGQDRLRTLYPDLERVERVEEVPGARDLLGTACSWLEPTVQDEPQVEGAGNPPLSTLTWPDPVRRGIAHAVVGQTAAQVVNREAVTAMEQRLVALGAPLDRPLRSDLRSDLGLLREWLLIRLETSPEVTSCALRAEVAGIIPPAPLPAQAQGEDGTVGAEELKDLADLADQVYSALYRFVADLACGCLLPPPADCADTDVFLATVELDDCTVVRICSAGREQVLPGGASYGLWLPQLPYLWDFADGVCCRPVPKDSYTSDPDGISLPFAPGWLLFLSDSSDLSQLLVLLGVTPGSQDEAADFARLRAPFEATLAVRRASGSGPVPRPAPAPAAAPAPATAADQDVADLRDQLAAVTARLADLESRAQPAPGPGSAAEQEPEQQPGVGPAPPTPPRRRPAARRTPQETPPADGTGTGDGDGNQTPGA